MQSPMAQTLAARAARGIIFVYRLTFSALVGRYCRYLPSCSEYADEAIRSHGLWAGSWMGTARICRCRPGGGDGFDPVPVTLPENAGPFTPWRYGRWRGPFVCEGEDVLQVETSARGTAPDESRGSERDDPAVGDADAARTARRR
jgi:putative membrane protein insertion efficiency factor